jgi:hypothetical protein
MCPIASKLKALGISKFSIHKKGLLFLSEALFAFCMFNPLAKPIPLQYKYIKKELVLTHVIGEAFFYENKYLVYFQSDHFSVTCDLCRSRGDRRGPGHENPER